MKQALFSPQSAAVGACLLQALQTWLRDTEMSLGKEPTRGLVQRVTVISWSGALSALYYSPAAWHSTRLLKGGRKVGKCEGQWWKAHTILVLKARHSLC